MALEGRWRVYQAEYNDVILEMTVSSPESRLPFVALLDPDHKVGIADIKLSKILHA
jgi:hypothetical protein